ncbi:MAG: TolC family protein [Sulfurimonas sp.]|nr:TolC family protein [Sulfurimonas sp.]
MKKIVSILSLALFLHASQVDSPLSLNEAIDILKEKNLEIKNAGFDVDSAAMDKEIVSANHWGKLDLTQDIARSNDAGNVFGFKLASREANFGDFGAEEFMGNFLAGTPDYTTPPQDLNYPDARNFFQTKLKYEVPLFTGFAISSYEDIMSAMQKMKTLDKEQITAEQIYQLRKSYYDMALLQSSKKHLTTIFENIKTLENTTKTMIDVGYAKNVDLLEVQAKKGNVQRLLVQMDANEKLLYHYISFLLNQKVDVIQTPDTEVPMPSYSNEEILNANLDLKKANTGLAIQENMLDVSKAAFYPTVGAFAEASTADDTFLGDAIDHRAYTIGARASWNIFHGGADNAQLEKSQVEKLKTKTQLELARQGIALQVEKIRTEITSFDEEISFLEQELTLADEIYKNYEGRYREKLSSMSDVIIKQSEQIQKILQLQMTKNKKNERIFALEKLANGENK